MKIELITRVHHKGWNMNEKTHNVLIAGVGGQGVLLISEILSLACLKGGHDVKKSEVHGMAQRGGSVISHIRYGRRVRSPLIEKGRGHVLLALEELEALRWSDLLRPDGTIILNSQQIRPLPVAVGLQNYPRGIPTRLSKYVGRMVIVDAVELARQAGNIRSANMVMLGALSAHLDLAPAVLRNLVRSRLPQKTWAVNLKALKLGREAYGGKRDRRGKQVGVVSKKKTGNRR
jgi:indolepyruvate ferredoxin oxidoreductase beta subunit